ncbi:MAG TPA: PQQ-binding-like beta-propeller repeat protein, partial [Gemmataceae bacterium]|nr:PQQ-binding-like beta-propeller repeat protein [Gemmataceae bacterium]
WGNKVFLTTAVAKNQTKPKPGQMGFGGMGGGPGGRRGPGGFGVPPKPGQVLPTFLQYFLRLTDDQKKQLGELQKHVDEQLAKVLTADQQKQFNQPAGGPGRGGFGGFSPPPPAGQIMPANQRTGLKLTDEQKKQVDELQKDVDGRLARLLTAAQNKQLKDMQQAFGRGGRGGFGPGGRGGFGRGGRGGFGGGFGGGPAPNVVYRWEVYCLDAANGKVLWKQVAAERKPRTPKQPSNSYASETPITDGERLYAYFGNTGLFCYDLDGKLLWSKDLGAYPTAGGWGTGSSPAVDGDRLFVQCDNEQQSFLVALDKKTGDELWRTKRQEKTVWSTPYVWHNRQRTELIANGQTVRSYDPATGNLLWELGSGQPSGGPRGMGGMNGPTSSPVADRDLLYVGLGSRMGMRTLFAVKPGATGDISVKTGETTSSGVAWSRRGAGPAMASPLLYRGHLYVLEERGGILICVDAKTGQQAYRQRLPQAGGFTASPWAYDGRVFCLDDRGKTFVIEAGPKFKLLGTNALQEMCWASPAIADGSLFIRGEDDLFAVGPKSSDK